MHASVDDLGRVLRLGGQRVRALLVNDVATNYVLGLIRVHVQDGGHLLNCVTWLA